MSDTPPVWITKLFASLDAKDVTRWLEYLADDARFRYGSLAPIEGKSSIQAFVGAFVGNIRSFEHKLLNVWTPPGSAICQGEVYYVLHDGREISVPFTNVFHLQGNAIHDYLVYIDPTPLGASV